ncbi:MAG: hypothetical protein OXU81_08625, partial [Gammaproteobacteria bacterium]|nr:hypothetical protein [Gammaproteobacteria bacterium]
TQCEQDPPNSPQTSRVRSALGAAAANAQARAPDPAICVRYAEADHGWEHSPPRVEAQEAYDAVVAEAHPVLRATKDEARALELAQRDRAKKAYDETMRRARAALEATQNWTKHDRARRAAQEALENAQYQAMIARRDTERAADDTYQAAVQTERDALEEANARAETEREAAYNAVYDSDPHAAQSDVDTLMKKLKRRHRALCEDIVHRTYAPAVATCVRYPEAEEAWEQSPAQAEANAAYEVYRPVVNEAMAVRSAKQEQARAILRAETGRAEDALYAEQRRWDAILNAIGGDTSRAGEKKAALQRASEIRDIAIQRAQLRHKEYLAAAEAEFEATVRETKTAYEAARARSLAVRQAAFDAIYDSDPEAVRSDIAEITTRLRDRHEYLCKYVLALHM